MGFWERGALCDFFDGDALLACGLNIVTAIMGLPPLGNCWMCCCWEPNIKNFRRSALMDGGKYVGVPQLVAEPLHIGIHQMFMQEGGMQPMVMQPMVMCMQMRGGTPAMGMQQMVGQPVVMQPMGYQQPMGYMQPMGYQKPMDQQPGALQFGVPFNQ